MIKFAFLCCVILLENSADDFPMCFGICGFSCLREFGFVVFILRSCKQLFVSFQFSVVVSSEARSTRVSVSWNQPLALRVGRVLKITFFLFKHVTPREWCNIRLIQGQWCMKYWWCDSFSQKLSNFTHFDTWNAMKRKTQGKSGLKKEEVNNSGSQGIAWLDGPFTALKMMLCRFRITIHIKLTLHNSSQFGWISLGFNHKVELSFSANTQASWARLGRGKPESTRSASWNQAQERRKRDLEARKRVLQEKFSFGKYYYR